MKDAMESVLQHVYQELQPRWQRAHEFALFQLLLGSRCMHTAAESRGDIVDQYLPQVHGELHAVLQKL